MKRTGSFYILLGVLAVGTSTRADMMPVFAAEGGARPLPPACVTATTQHLDFSTPFEGGSVADLGLLPVLSLPVLGDDVAVGLEAQPPALVLTEGQDSFSLCLCALLSLGLCRSVPWMRKLHLGSIPDWYHHGGPFQIGHSHAISPNCLSHAPPCFVQPDGTADRHIPQYHFATVVARWRTSQFTPATLASRGPPNMSERLSPTYFLT